MPLCVEELDVASPALPPPACCNNTHNTTYRRYAAAFDWRDTSATAFKPDLYYNDTYGLPRNEAPTVYQRVPQVLNMAVNSWLKNVLGELRAVMSFYIFIPANTVHP
jgi:hypothetical protein